MKEKLTKKQKERIESFLQERLVSIRITDKNGTRTVSTVDKDTGLNRGRKI